MQVKTVQEVYFDYYISNSNVFHLNIESCISNLAMTPVNQWVKYDEMMCNRIVEGLVAICLSNRIFPMIKCVKGSAICELISKRVGEFFQENYDFIKKECSKEPNGLLFLFDRKEDPVTPLINQWTYQAMLQELIGIKNNVITIKEKDKKEDKLVISDIEEIDRFFFTHMNNDYGTVANEIEKAAEKLKRENSEISKKDTSIEELKRIIEALPEKKKESMAITKHYKLFYELSEYITKHKLMDLSPIEQDIACNDNKKDQLNKIASFLPDEKVSALDKAKLYLLYVFRYEDDSSIPALKQLMAQNKMKEWIDYGDLLIEYAGKEKRILDVLSNKDFLSKGKKMFMNAFGSKENIFMQHVSYLSSIIERLIKGRLGPEEIDTILRGNNNEMRPNKLIVFNFGGITYEETKDLTVLGKQLDIPIIAGGTNILNSKSFLAELLMAKKKKTDEVLIDIAA